MVGPRVVNADDGADQDYPDRFPSVAQMIRRAVAGPQFPARDHDTPVEIERIHGACLMTRAVVLRQIGLLDEDFFMYDEDVDWCIRARKAGWRLLLLPNARVRHYGGKTSGRMPSGQRARVPPGEGSLRMRYELRRSRYLLYRKHRSAAETALLKLITDSALVADSALWLLRALASHQSRAACLAVLRWNLRIIRLNPFGLRTTS
jgi:N-acetylglucosaminyl-diphospho-decaprenol L-rhamnosyltransferase